MQIRSRRRLRNPTPMHDALIALYRRADDGQADGGIRVASSLAPSRCLLHRLASPIMMDSSGAINGGPPRIAWW